MSDSKTNRRALLLLGAGLAAVAGGWQFWVSRPTPLAFEAIEGLPGWRRMASGRITGSAGTATDAIFLGIDEGDTLPPLPEDMLCSTLYPKPSKGIPAAIFTDVNCPNCASLEAKLNARRDRLDLNWHDLPLLGPSSETAARAMIAGDLQSKGAVFRQAIQSTSPGRLTPPGLYRLATNHDLNPDQLLKDMSSPEVNERLQVTRRAAQTLGVWGTPGFTIGRTFVLGDMPAHVLDQLIELEADFTNCQPLTEHALRLHPA